MYPDYHWHMSLYLYTEGILVFPSYIFPLVSQTSMIIYFSLACPAINSIMEKYKYIHQDGFVSSEHFAATRQDPRDILDCE